jgi:hypothetical protein
MPAPAARRQDLHGGSDPGFNRLRTALLMVASIAAAWRQSGCSHISRTPLPQRHDSIAFTALMADIRIIRSSGARARTRPDRVLADKAYSTAKIRNSLRRRGIKATIPQPVNQLKARIAKGSEGGRPPTSSSTKAPSTSPASRSGSETLQKDLRDTP